MTAGGLSPNQLRALLEQHGSLEEVARARPDLAPMVEQIREASQLAARFGETARRAGEAMRSWSGPLEEREQIDAGLVRPEAVQIELLREIADGLAEEDTKRLGRPLDELPIPSVAKAEARLKERRKVTRTGARATGKLTYEAIAVYAGLVTAKGRPNRDRVTQLEELMVLGWPLRKSHPDFPAKANHVRLPTPREAARLLHSR